MKLLIVCPFCPEAGGSEALACGTKVVIPPYLSGFPYAKMCTVADEGELAKKIFEAKPAAQRGVAHFQTKFESAKIQEDFHVFDWDIIAQEMEYVYTGMVG